MAQTIEFIVSYGNPEVTQSALVSGSNSLINFGSADTYPLDQVQYPIQQGENSYERYIRLFVSDFGGSSSISNIRVYSTTTPSQDTTLNYGQTQTYNAPVNTQSTIATQSIPFSLPTSENLYINGQSGNSITPGSSSMYSDYAVFQVTSSQTQVAGTTMTINVAYSEVQ